MKKKVNERNTAIQILRIIACILVFMVHFGQRLEFEDVAKQITDFGMYGVHLFFIISGFLAVKTLQKKEKVTTYYLKRVISILVLYYIVIIWYFITENYLHKTLNHIPGDIHKLYWLRYIYLLNGFVESDTYFWNNLGMTWTIPIFAFFYLIIPYILKIIKNYKSSFILMIVIYHLTTYLNELYPCTVFANLYYFFIGIFIYYCYKDKKLRLCSVLFLIKSIYCTIIGEINYYYIFAVIISVLLEKEIKIKEIPKKVINKLDEYTYTLYLAHGIVFCSIIDKLPLFEIELPKFVLGTLAIGVSIILTILIHDYIERPIQNILKNKLLKLEQKNI